MTHANTWVVAWGNDGYTAPDVTTPTEEPYKPMPRAKKLTAATVKQLHVRHPKKGPAKKLRNPRSKELVRPACKCCGVRAALRNGYCTRRLCREVEA